MSASNLLQLLASGITIGAVYALLALGFVTIYRSSKVVNFAQGEFAMLGGLGTVYLFKSLQFNYPIGAAIAVIATALIGMVVYQLIVAPLGRGVSTLSIVMATIGASLLLQSGALLVWGPFPSDLPAFTGDSPIDVAGVAVLHQGLWVILMAALIVAALYLLGNHTLLGKAMTATATDPLAAGYVGVSTGAMIRWSFAISACIGALTGLFLAPMFPLNYISGGLLGLKGLTALTLGGWGLATGAIAGGLTLGIVETFGAGLLPSGYKDAIAFVVLIIILYLRPSGILGSSEAGEFKLD